jgi:hypothetical protein
VIAVKPLVLLLCDYREDIAATVREHIVSLTGRSRHRFRKVSILGNLPPRLDLAHFDVGSRVRSFVGSRLGCAPPLDYPACNRALLMFPVFDLVGASAL